MSATLDLRRATIVVLGAWNQSIFAQPGWLARYLFGVDEGTEIEIAVMQNVENGQSVFIFGDAAISQFANRVEIYALGIDRFTHAEAVVSRLCDVLPHTPVSAVGINFHFLVTEGVGDLSEKLSTKENLDEFGEIVKLDGTVQLRRDGTNINIKRATDFKNATIEFNYHKDVSNTRAISEYVASSPIADCLGVSNSLLFQIYELTHDQTTTLASETPPTEV